MADKTSNRQQMKGTGVSPGLAMGRLIHWPPLSHGDQEFVQSGRLIAGADGLVRFDQAVHTVQMDLALLQEQLRQRGQPDAAAIMETHSAIAGDPELAAGVQERILNGLNLPQAIEATCESFTIQLEALDDPYLAARGADIRDVSARLVHALTNDVVLPEAIYSETVIVARELPPSVVARLDPARIKAIITEQGGATSHAALLAKGLGIPAIMACPGILISSVDGDLVAVNGSDGTVILSPTALERAEITRQIESAQKEAAELTGLLHLPAVTRGGRRVTMSANLGSAREASIAKAAGAEAIGLFRTEFLFLDRATLPEEEEQLREYRAVLEAMAPHPVVIRTLDIGGDKPISALSLPREDNPFLGHRGIRLWLERVELARTQIRALLRAARYGDLHVMLPMITDVSELRRAKARIEQVKTELGPAAGPYQIGVMIEVPAAALTATALAAECDFFSIGTNDLVQYTMAADRGNPRVAHLLDPLHPAVLRLIELTVEAARSTGIPVAVCGDAAADPAVVPTLVALGIDELSMPPSSIPRVKHLIRQLES